MKDESKSKEQLIKELTDLRKRVIELQDSENQLNSDEEILRIFRTSMPIGLLSLQDGKIKFVNDNFREFLADVSDEIIESYSMRLIYSEEFLLGQIEIQIE